MSLGWVDFVWKETCNYKSIYARITIVIPRLLDDQLTNKVLSAFLLNNTISNAINTYHSWWCLIYTRLIKVKSLEDHTHSTSIPSSWQCVSYALDQTTGLAFQHHSMVLEHAKLIRHSHIIKHKCIWSRIKEIQALINK